MMRIEAVANEYTRLLATRFPNIVVRVPDNFDRVGTLHAHNIPDTRMDEFMRYLLDIFCHKIIDMKLPIFGLIPFSRSQTRRHYPEIWRAIPHSQRHTAEVKRGKLEKPLEGGVSARSRRAKGAPRAGR